MRSGKTVFLISFFFIFLSSLSAEELKSHYRKNTLSPMFQIGSYQSFDSMNSSLLDIRYGWIMPLLDIKRPYPLISGILDLGGILVFQESKEPFVEVIPGLGINFQLRINLFQLQNNPIYMEGGYGIVFYARPYPDGGTLINGARTVGIGIQVHSNHSSELMITGRWYHNSNADLIGRSRNPGLDTLGIALAVMLR